MITARNCMHVMNMLYKTGNLINLTIITLKLKCKLSTARKIHIRAIPLKQESTLTFLCISPAGLVSVNFN